MTKIGQAASNVIRKLEKASTDYRMENPTFEMDKRDPMTIPADEVPVNSLGHAVSNDSASELAMRSVIGTAMAVMPDGLAMGVAKAILEKDPLYLYMGAFVDVIDLVVRPADAAISGIAALVKTSPGQTAVNAAKTGFSAMFDHGYEG